MINILIENWYVWTILLVIFIILGIFYYKDNA